jgi:hypothetical protein
VLQISFANKNLDLRMWFSVPLEAYVTYLPRVVIVLRSRIPVVGGAPLLGCGSTLGVCVLLWFVKDIYRETAV